MEKLVSVLIPAYNHEKYIKKAIESVLNQTYKNIEVIVEDDCSTDNTVREIKKIKDKRLKTIFSKKNKGPVKTMNHLLSICKGDYIAILGSDDVWYPDKLEKQLPYFKNKKIGAVFSMMDVVDENDRINENDPIIEIFKNKNMSRGQRMRCFFEKGNHLCHPTSIISRKAFEDIGYYNCAYRQLHDFDYWVRLTSKYDIYILNDKLIGYRRVSNGQNLSSATNEHILMHINEENNIIQYLFKIIDDNTFIDGFKPLFKNKDSSSKNELICEKFLILLKTRIGNVNNKYLAINYLSTLDNCNEIMKLLEKKYNYKLEKFYKDNARLHNFYDDNIIMNNDESIRHYRDDYEQLHKEYEKAVDELNRLYNSKSWKITKPLRFITERIKK